MIGALPDVKEIVVVGNTCNSARIVKFLPQFIKRNSSKLRVSLVTQSEKIKGMAGGVMSAKAHCAKSDVLIVSANDVVEEEAFDTVLETAGVVGNYRRGGEEGKSNTPSAIASVVLLGYEVPSYFPGGYLKLGHAKRVDGIVEKPGEGKEPSSFVNIVVHYYRSYDLLYKAMSSAKTTRDDRYEVALDSLISQGMNVVMAHYSGFWQPLKFPWDVLTLDEHLLKRRMDQLALNADYVKKGDALVHSSAQIAPSATIKGEVLIDEGCKVFENAVIQGPAYLGEGSIVGNQALMRNSFTGKKCVVGYATEVARSHFEDDVWTHSNYIGDSVIGSNVSFGAGAITANLRLDEGAIKWQGEKTNRTKLGLVTGDHVRVGVQTCLMPGISIGSNSMVGGGITVGEDIGPDEFVYGKTNLIRKKNKADIKILRRG